MIDWVSLLTAHGIEFVESGPSTAKGNIYCKCPWCGTADGGHHLGISLKGRGWGCWKRKEHRGKSARRLLAGLLGISIANAQALLDGLQGASLASDDQIQRKVKAMRGTEQGAIVADEKLDFTDDIKPIEIDKRSSHLFVEYLEERGWSRDQASQAIFRYKLRYAMKGAFSYRLVIPVFGEKGLLTWTGRTIAPDIEPRYKTLSVDPEKAADDGVPVARANIKNCLFDERDLFTKMGRGLIVCEGPLDAIRIDFVGRQHGVKGTCLFGKTFSDEQIDKLIACAPYYGKKLLLLDQDAGMDAYRMIERVRAFGYKVAKLPRGYKDPGDMSLNAVEDFINQSI